MVWHPPSFTPERSRARALTPPPPTPHPLCSCLSYSLYTLTPPTPTASLIFPYAGTAFSPLRPDDVPKPVLPFGVICYNCRVQLTLPELNSFAVGVHSKDISTNRKWRRHHADCTHKQTSSVSIDNFDIMLSKLSDIDRVCVISSVAEFAAAKNANFVAKPHSRQKKTLPTTPFKFQSNLTFPLLSLECNRERGVVTSRTCSVRNWYVACPQQPQI